MLSGMSHIPPDGFARLYTSFQSPIAALDCGKKCSPYNEFGAPFCCDTRHAVPSAYQAEWEYLQAHTNLWHLWQSPVDEAETARVQSQAAPGQVLIECQGHLLCQREYRSMVCREFPFSPYVTRQGAFIGLSYYREYADRCWVISNLPAVTHEYRQQFIQTYDTLFANCPEEKEIFRYHSGIVRRVYGRQHQAITLLHRDGEIYAVTPRDGSLKRVDIEDLPKFGPYAVTASLAFPDELESGEADSHQQAAAA